MKVGAAKKVLTHLRFNRCMTKTIDDIANLHSILRSVKIRVPAFVQEIIK